MRFYITLFSILIMASVGRPSPLDGPGLSCLAILEAKNDRTFVRDLVTDPGSQILFDPDFTSSGGVVARRSPNAKSEPFQRTDRKLNEVITEHGLSKREFMGYLSGPILDVGCGNGQFVRDLVGKGYNAVGVDIYLAPEQIAQPQLFSRQDSAFLNFADESFRVIVSTQSCLTYESIAFRFTRDGDYSVSAKVLNELKRVLEPGGRILIAPIGDFYDFVSVVNAVGGLQIESKHSVINGHAYILYKPLQ
jgi:SAM-dependent methyltransferase